ETAVLLAGLYETHAATTRAATMPGAVIPTEPTLRNSPESMDRKWWAGLKAKIQEPVMPHLVYLPADYEKNPAARWPVLLCLAGKGERGDNLAQLKEVGLLARLEYNADFRKSFPFIVVAPQCRENDWWSSHELARLLDDVEAKHRVDVDREYVT